ncbi:MAG: hypothetical protein M3Y80_11290 [Verrucomicrobiota bacterium]|nr:hypothetical protein [Verrucomicrobiota bacterium]
MDLHVRQLTVYCAHTYGGKAKRHWHRCRPDAAQPYSAERRSSEGHGLEAAGAALRQGGGLDGHWPDEFLDELAAAAAPAEVAAFVAFCFSCMMA